MATPEYQVVCLHPVTGKVLRIYDGQTPYQTRYSRAWNGIGALAITLPMTDVEISIMNLVDMFIEVKRTSPITGQLETEETYLARSWQRYRQGDDERYTIGALSLNHLLARRLIDPDDDPAEAGGYSTKAGAADTVLYQYALEQIGLGCPSVERQMPGLSIAGVAGTSTNIGYRLAYDNLFQIFQETGKSAVLDFQIVRTTGVQTQLNIGTLTVNRTQTANYPNAPFVLLNPQRGNLSNPSLTRDRKSEGNFVYVRGKGQGTARILLKFWDGGAINASPFNRIEFAQDARNVEKGDALGILTDAANSIKERQQFIQFEFQPLGTEPGNIYRQNWDVGDRITAAWGNDSVDVRITEVEITVDGSGENLAITTEVL